MDLTAGGKPFGEGDPEYITNEDMAGQFKTFLKETISGNTDVMRVGDALRDGTITRDEVIEIFEGMVGLQGSIPGLTTIEMATIMVEIVEESTAEQNKR